MVDFSSEGPARITNKLKPDIAAPGSDITSADGGTGDGSATFSGTSMAAPHISGVAALLRQIHPGWSPARIKAVIMNQATQDVTNLDGTGPVPATVFGSGRVQAFESATTHNLATPGSLSFGLSAVSDFTTMVKKVTLRNLDSVTHTYEVSADVRYTDFSPRFASVQVAVGDEQLADSRTFTLKGGRKASIFIEVTLDPDSVPKWQQLYGWYYFNPNVDGNVNIVQTDGKDDAFHVPWHASALATADTDVGVGNLDLTGGAGVLPIVEGGFGLNYADLYLLGATSPEDIGGEADIAAIGARTFVGAQVDGVAEGLPEGTDPLAGLTFLEFVTQVDEPTELIEFVVQSHDPHNNSDTQEVDVLIDVGADGNFSDDTIGADAMLILLPGTGSGGTVCLFDLPSTFEACDATYFAHYSIYNSDLVGLPVDAGALGLTNGQHALSYQVVSCTGVFAGDVPESTCDVAGDVDPDTGYVPTLDVTDPALVFGNQVVGGFWKGPEGDVDVSVGSAAAGDDPGILVVFPNNTPGDMGTVVTTGT